MTGVWKNPVWGVLLWPLAILYRSVIALRRFLYTRKIISSNRLAVKVISIGNITVGGTGKTPLVNNLAHLLQSKGYHVGIVSRGYRGKKDRTVLASDGEKTTASPETAGDEPFLLSRRLHDVPIMADKNRVRAGQYAIDKFGCNTILLDDGFQHLKMKRDIDIVVIDSTNPWGNGKLIPAGPLRESLKSLGRADVVIFTRVDQTEGIEELRTRVKRYTDAPILTSVHRPVEWISLKTHKGFPADFLEGKHTLGIAGIGNPESFYNTLSGLKVRIADFITYRDHHRYTDKDMKHIGSLAEKHKVEAVVTTEKDSVRLPTKREYKIPVYYLRIELVLMDGSEKLNAILEHEL